jgi:hypothetical protein
MIREPSCAEDVVLADLKDFVIGARPARRGVRFIEDLGWDDVRIEEFVDHVCARLRVAIPRPFMGSTVGALIVACERRLERRA